jgi:hypothetical protein
MNAVHDVGRIWMEISSQRALLAVEERQLLDVDLQPLILCSGRWGEMELRVRGRNTGGFIVSTVLLSSDPRDARGGCRAAIEQISTIVTSTSAPAHA